jgi:RNase P subunit RPR2
MYVDDPTDEFRCTRCRSVSVPGITLSSVVDAGYLVYECPVCGKVDLRKITPETGHEGDKDLN